MRAPTITDPPQQLGQLHGLSPKRVAAVPDIVNKPAKNSSPTPAPCERKRGPQETITPTLAIQTVFP